MKVATCLQHVPFEGPGVFRQALEAQGYAVKTIPVPSQGLPQATPYLPMLHQLADRLIGHLAQ